MEALFLFNNEAEAAILGALLIEPELIKDCPLKTEHFSPGRHTNVFYTMLDMDSKGIPIDLVTIVERVGKKLDKLGGVGYLSELAASVPTTANFNRYCGIVIEYYQRRQAIEIANKIKQAATEGNALEAIQSGVNSLMEVEDSGTDDDDGDIKEALVDMYDKLENATDDVTGIPTGFTELDRLTGGYQDGQLIVVGARPSVGKTAFAVNKGINASRGPHNLTGDVVGLFSLEMGKVELLQRGASIIGGIDAQRMKSAAKSFVDDDWNKLTHALGQLNQMDLRIFDKSGIDVNYIWSKTRKLKREFPGRRIMIIIDYLQLIRGSKEYRGNRNLEIGGISRSLKDLARELKVVVVALSQLSRGVESRQEKRPMMSDLRESGDIEQDSDIIQLLYRDDYYSKDSEKKDIIEIIMAKHRGGPVGNVELAFIKEYGKFVNLERRFE